MSVSCNLVIYTHEELYDFVVQCSKPNYKIVKKEIPEFYNYRYKSSWEENHTKNESLKHTSWELNMLWSEKIHFVNETVEKRYFDTEFYGWIDVGYFREDYTVTNWPNPDKIKTLESKIYYACVNNDENYINYIENLVRTNQRLPNDQVSIGGGFFILPKEQINWWTDTYDTKLKSYFDNKFLVKDDQIIIADCIFNNKEKFVLIKENDKYDNWFMFLRFLC